MPGEMLTAGFRRAQSASASPEREPLAGDGVAPAPTSRFFSLDTSDGENRVFSPSRLAASNEIVVFGDMGDDPHSSPDTSPHEVAEEAALLLPDRGPIIDSDQVTQQCALAGDPASPDTTLAAVLEGVQDAVEEGFGRLKGAISSSFF